MLTQDMALLLYRISIAISYRIRGWLHNTFCPPPCQEKTIIIIGEKQGHLPLRKEIGKKMSKSVDKRPGVWYYTWAPSAETKEWLLKSQQEALEKNQWTFKSFVVAKAMNRPSGAFKQTERSCESKMEGSHPDKLTVSTEKLLSDLSSEKFKSFSKIKLDKKPLLW